MDKKYPDIIALACSPSHGRNSDSMLDSFILGVKDGTSMTIEKIYLSDIPIDDYKFENSTGTQEHEVLFKELCDKVQNAKALVISTPTYNFSVPARLKNFIDRIRFFALDFKNKTRLKQPVGKLGYLRVYFLVSGGTPTWIQKMFFFTFPPFWLRSVFLYFGSHCLGAYYSGDVATFKNHKILNACRLEGKRFADKMNKRSENPLLERIFFRTPQIDD